MNGANITTRKPNPLLERVISSYSVVKQKLDNYIKTDKGCWEYQGNLDSNGYGRFTICNKKLKPYKAKIYAHRASYAFYRLQEPGDYFVCHSCDNPKCINPDHLFLGTAKDNMQDMSAKGRGNPQKGILNTNCKLTIPQVREIKRLIKGGLNNTQIARKFPVTHSMVSAIKLGKAWESVE